MKVYNDFKEIKKDLKDRPLALTIGNFDGVHLGHQYLLKNYISFCQQRGLTPIILTFSPHPVVAIKGKKAHNLFPNEVNFEYIKRIGFDYILKLKFDKNLQQKKGELFIKEILEELPKIKGFFLGHDFSLGENKEFGLEEFKKLFSEHYELHIENIYETETIKPSSSLIREFLGKGNITQANKLLGRSYNIRGKVIHGNKIGNTLGFPTANLDYSESIILPKTGVYFARANVQGRRYAAAVNIGKRPSITSDKVLSIEAHLLNCSENLYNKEIKIDFIKFIRDEIKFKTKEELIQAIKEDISKIEKLPYEYSFALIGKNIQHSRSADVYSELLEGYPISYALLDYPEESKIEDLKKLLLEYKRISITSPYKKFCFDHSISDFKNLQAVNTLKLDDDKVIGTNTDYIACRELIKKYQVKKYDHLILLGNGAMANTIANIFLENDLSYKQFSRRQGNLSNIGDFLAQLRGTILVINSCSREYTFPEVKKVKFDFWDLNYSMPEHIKLFHSLSLKYVDGRELLYLQAKNALSFWNLKTT